MCCMKYQRNKRQPRLTQNAINFFCVMFVPFACSAPRKTISSTRVQFRKAVNAHTLTLPYYFKMSIRRTIENFLCPIHLTGHKVVLNVRHITTECKTMSVTFRCIAYKILGKGKQNLTKINAHFRNAIKPCRKVKQYSGYVRGP